MTFSPLLAAVLIIPWTLGRLLEKTLGRLVRRRLEPIYLIQKENL